MKELEEGRDLLLDFNKLAKVGATGQALLPVVLADGGRTDGATRTDRGISGDSGR